MLCLHNVWSFHFKSQLHQVDDGGHRPSFLYWTNMSHYFPPAWGGWQGCHGFSTLSIQIIATFILSSILFPPLISFSKVSIMRKAGDILFAFLFQIFIFQVHRRRCVISTFGYSITPSKNSSLFPGLPWRLEHRWCHPCQCRSFHQWIKQGWEQSNMTAFIWCSSINLAFLF